MFRAVCAVVVIGAAAAGGALSVRSSAVRDDAAPDAARTVATDDSSPSTRSMPRPRGGKKWQSYLPNVELITHRNEKVRFYDDLVKGKIVVINFMYTTCRGT